MKIILLIACILAKRFSQIANLYKYASEVAAMQRFGKTESVTAITKPTSNSARLEAMRLAGIPTSQMPIQVTKNASGKQYQYLVKTKGGGSAVYSVQQQSLDSSHKGEIHWEAGKVKLDDNGNLVWTRWKAPRLDNSKVKVGISDKR